MCIQIQKQSLDTLPCYVDLSHYNIGLTTRYIMKFETFNVASRIPNFNVDY